METKPTSQSPFFNPRGLFSFGFGALGLLLAVLAFTAFPASTARAVPVCSEVYFEEVIPSYGVLYVKMISDEGCTIYYTISAFGYPSNPTHSSNVYNPSPYYDGIPVPDGQYRYFKAFAHKTTSTPHDGDSGITSHQADNTQN